MDEMGICRKAEWIAMRFRVLGNSYKNIRNVAGLGSGRRDEHRAILRTRKGRAGVCVFAGTAGLIRLIRSARCAWVVVRHSGLP